MFGNYIPGKSNNGKIISKGDAIITLMVIKMFMKNISFNNCKLNLCIKWWWKTKLLNYFIFFSQIFDPIWEKWIWIKAFPLIEKFIGKKSIFDLSKHKF